MARNSTEFRMLTLLTSLLAVSLAAVTGFSQSVPEMERRSQAPNLEVSRAPRTALPVVSIPKSEQARSFYKTVLGIDDIQVRAAASGALIRFSYRIVDASRAKALNDKKATPYLIDQKTGAMLQVPTMEKVGMLRQTAAPENGREYWMVFSNKGHYVERGSRVEIQIGNARIEGLVVE